MEVGGRHHVDEAVGEARVEDDRPPVRPDRAMPPRITWPAGVCIQLFAARIQKTGHGGAPARPEAAEVTCNQGGTRLHPKSMTPRKVASRKNACQHLIADERPDDVTDHLREAAPVRAELIGERNARDHAHGEADREDPGPETGQAMKVLLAGSPPEHQQRGHVGRGPDREGRKDDVDGDRERELQPRREAGHRPTVASPIEGGPASSCV